MKSRYSTTLQPSPETSLAGPELGDKDNGEVQAAVLSKPFTSKPNLNLNNPAKFNPFSGVQTLNISPLKPKVSLLKNIYKLPTLSSLNVYKPFGGSMFSPNAGLNVKNSSFDGERPPDNNVSLPFKNQDENPGVASSKNLNNKIFQSTAFTMNQKNKTLPAKTGLKAHDINNYIKAPITNGVTSLSASKPQLATYSNNEKVASQKSVSEEDKLIEDGITALQHRLQAPLQISAVAKSNAGCKQRLCREKVKTQQAKTRETISDRGENHYRYFCVISFTTSFLVQFFWKDISPVRFHHDSPSSQIEG